MLFLRLLGLLVLFFMSDLAFSRSGLERLDLELKRMPFQRDYFYPGQLKWGHEISLKLKYDKNRFLFESDITGQTFNDRFRNVWWDYEVSLNFRSNFGRFYLESDITGQTAYSRFRNIWWDYTLGLRIIDEIDLVWDHRSQHAMDWYVDKFPVRDSAGIRINFLK